MFHNLPTMMKTMMRRHLLILMLFGFSNTTIVEMEKFHISTIQYVRRSRYQMKRTMKRLFHCFTKEQWMVAPNLSSISYCISKVYTFSSTKTTKKCVKFSVNQELKSSKTPTKLKFLKSRTKCTKS
jgi:hypothetical protein